MINLIKLVDCASGLTHEGDSSSPDNDTDPDEYLDDAFDKKKDLEDRKARGDLINFRLLMQDQPVIQSSVVFPTRITLTCAGLSFTRRRSLPSRMAFCSRRD
jgi:hypothetical protein